MNPRLYLADRQPRQLPRSKPAQVAGSIPTTARLYSIREASAILSELYGEGYSQSSIISLIDNKDWQEGIHWCDRRRKGGKYRKPKIYLEAVKQWQCSRADERS